MHASFPHLGTTHDAKVWRATAHQHPMAPRELALGDPAYVGADQVLVKHKKPKGGSLTAQQKVTNRVIDGYRSRVEHIIGFIKHHGIFNGSFRGLFGWLLLWSKLLFTQQTCACAGAGRVSPAAGLGGTSLAMAVVAANNN